MNIAEINIVVIVEVNIYVVEINIFVHHLSDNLKGLYQLTRHHRMLIGLEN